MNTLQNGLSMIVCVLMHSLSRANTQSCFSVENPPLCLPHTELIEDEHDVQEVCFQLDYDYLDIDKVTFNLPMHINALSTLPLDSTLCEKAKKVYHLCYWCADNATSNSCDLKNCYDEADVVYDNVDVNATCDELDSILFYRQWPAYTDLCYRSERVAQSCPNFCKKYFSYLGADTPAKKKALQWLSRIAAFMTFLGASFIIWDVVSNVMYRTAVFHQLLFAMACFDIITAIAWAFAAAPMPADGPFWIVGTKGSKQTCTAQGFFVQLGLTSVFYNVSLAVYYVLVIVYRWRERDLQAIRHYLFGIPFVVGVCLAVVGIRYYRWIEYGCHLRPPPDGEIWKTLVLVVLPIGFSIATITLSMLFVYLTVRRNAQASRKWRFGVGSPSKLQTQVFWQALFYSLSFYVTWPIIFLVYIASIDLRVEHFAFTALVSFVAPLQGFTSFVVYIRPRLNNKMAKLASYISEAFSNVADRTSGAFGTGDMTENNEADLAHTPPATFGATVTDPSAVIASVGRSEERIPD